MLCCWIEHFLFQEGYEINIYVIESFQFGTIYTMCYVMIQYSTIFPLVKYLKTVTSLGLFKIYLCFSLIMWQ